MKRFPRSHKRLTAPHSRRQLFIEPLEQRQLLTANLAPVNSVPSSATTQVNTPVAFTEYHENLISISDPDAGDNPVEVTLTATHGTITLLDPDPNGGLTYSVGGGFEDASMTFTGTLSDINQALTWVVFHPETDYVGTAAALTITTNDQGYFGTGGPLEDTDLIPIEVTAGPAFEASPTWTTFPSALDTSFDSDGFKTLLLSDRIDRIYDMELLPDGTIVAVGTVNTRIGVFRFNGDDLSFKSDFGIDGIIEVAIGQYNDMGFVLEVDRFGRLLVGGIANGPNDETVILRYMADGQLDQSFGVNGVFRKPMTGAMISDIEIQADGSILIAQIGHGGIEYGSYFGATEPLSNFVDIDRLTPNGVLDTGINYDVGGRVLDVGKELLVRNDGSVLATGAGVWGTNSSGYSFRHFVTEFNESLSVTNEFLSPERIIVHKTIGLPDGKFLSVGEINYRFTLNSITPFGNATAAVDFVVTRHHYDGALDTTFGSGGKVQIPLLEGADRAYDVALQADGKIVVVGPTWNGSNLDFGIVRLNSDGSLDSSFSSDGKHSFSYGESDDVPYSVLVMPDGKIFVAGHTDNNIALLRLYGDNDLFGETANQDPTLDPLANVLVARNAPEQVVNLTGITDGDEGLQPLAIAATSSNTSLIPNPSVTYTSANATGSIAFTPTAEQSGVSTITVTVEDGGLDGNLATPDDNATFSREFTVWVNATPTMNPIPIQPLMGLAAGEQTVPLTGITAGADETQLLRVTATSSDESIIGAPSVDYTSAETTGTLRYEPTGTTLGDVTLTITVTDAGFDGDFETADDNGVFTQQVVVLIDETPWQNFRYSNDERQVWDVDDNEAIELLDPLIIVNLINRFPAYRASLPAVPTDLNQDGAVDALPGQGLFPDVNGDGKATLADALAVVNKIHQLASAPGPAGEGEFFASLANAPGPWGMEDEQQVAVTMAADELLASVAAPSRDIAAGVSPASETPELPMAVESELFDVRRVAVDAILAQTRQHVSAEVAGSEWGNHDVDFLFDLLTEEDWREFQSLSPRRKSIFR